MTKSLKLSFVTIASILGCNAILGIDEHEKARAAAGGAAGSQITGGSEGNPGGAAGTGGTVGAGGSGGTPTPTAGSDQGGGGAGESGGGNGGDSAGSAGQGPSPAGGSGGRGGSPPTGGGGQGTNPTGGSGGRGGSPPTGGGGQGTNPTGGSAGRGGSPPTNGGASSGKGGTGGGSPTPCTGDGIATECEKGFNCFNRICVPAMSSCQLHFENFQHDDGVYWINYAGIYLRTYCDMVLKRELCREVENGEQREGRTRDSTQLPYTMKARLDWTAGVCTIWAVRSTTGGVPLTPLYRNAGTAESPVLETRPIETCSVLGFTGSTAKSELGDCAYGDQATQCGFDAGYKVYSNWCQSNESWRCPRQMIGETYAYELTGTIAIGSVLSHMNGQPSSRCAVR